MKKNINIQIGVRVRFARERLHMTREALAELVGISTLFLGYIECGERGMSTETLLSICEALHVSTDYILLGREPASQKGCEAERLLLSFPQEYLPLAANQLRMLLKTISMIETTHKIEETLERDSDASSTLNMAARDGNGRQISLSKSAKKALEKELIDLKDKPALFED